MRLVPARLLSSSCLVLGLVLALPADARAAGRDDARCTLRSIQASGAPTAYVDPSLGDLKPQLTRPPLSAWNAFHLLGSHVVDLASGGARDFSLADGRAGRIEFLDHLGAAGGKHRLRLRLQLKHGADFDVNTVFVLDEGGTVLAAGHRHEGGIVIVAVSCSTAS